MLALWMAACGPGPADGETGAPTAPTAATGLPTSPVEVEGLLFREDFEASSVGTVPAGWRDFVGWVVDGGRNLPDAAVRALVDDDRARTGARALHVVGGSNPAQITRALPDVDRLYVRIWLWPTVQLGASPGRNHETLVGLRRASGQASDEVRFGEIKGVIGTNEVPSDNIAPRFEAWGQGPIIAPDGWRCVEVGFLADRTPHELHAWVDGIEVHAVTSPDDWNNGPLAEDWLDGRFGEVALGWHSFSGLDHELWIDDVVVATEGIGCE